MQKVQQQLVYVVARQQRITGQAKWRAAYFGAGQRAEVGLENPGHRQWHEWPQDASQARFCASTATCNEREFAVVPAYYIEQLAGVAKRPMMEYVRGLLLNAPVCRHCLCVIPSGRLIA